MRSTPPQSLSSFACLCAEFGDGRFQHNTTSWEPSSDIRVDDWCLFVCHLHSVVLDQTRLSPRVFLCIKLACMQWTGRWTIQQQDKRDFALASIWRHLEAPGLPSSRFTPPPRGNLCKTYATCLMEVDVSTTHCCNSSKAYANFKPARNGRPWRTLQQMDDTGRPLRCCICPRLAAPGLQVHGSCYHLVGTFVLHIHTYGLMVDP